MCDGALAEIDQAGAFVMAWRLPMGSKNYGTADRVCMTVRDETACAVVPD